MVARAKMASPDRLKVTVAQLREALLQLMPMPIPSEEEVAVLRFKQEFW